MNNKCVYVHLMNNQVVYIGSGSLIRYVDKSCRSKHHVSNWDSLEKIVLYYDETSPTCLRWRVNKARRAKKGSIAGSISKTGYFGLKVNSRNLLVHRVIWAIVNKENTPVTLVLDHIDRDKQNNRITNLRLVTQSNNNRNRSDVSSNTGEKYITRTRASFRLQYHTINGRSFETFSFSLKSKAKNHFKTQDEAFIAAVMRKNYLIESGVLI